MSLLRLNVTALRNLHAVTLSPSPRINILSGDNGSGKTSLLEAVHLLGLARSFRSTRLQPVIEYEQPALTIFGELASAVGTRQLGVQRSRAGEFQIRIDGQSVRSAAQLAQALPLQLINPDSFRLLEGNPRIRRQFLDWGVFHVEPRFLLAWQRLQRALRQRNSWLRRGTLDAASEAAWSRELSVASDEIDAYRRSYIQALKPLFEATLSRLLVLPDLVLSYYRGWDKDRELSEVLSTSLLRDQQLGHTQAGPQRADLRLRVGAYNAVDVLSRGQQKLVVCALKIAQGYLVNQSRSGECVYLVDDLPSELDEHHRHALCGLLEDLNCQVFITCVDHKILRECWQTDTPVAMFHVEHGRITQTHDYRE
ncbi:DNA replication/repair protein RecF [Pseudomonas sp. N040]|uniref:DNA replication/repair protein RecF n=1 Tax=Pseudomonas sp. N040 TaxID=2785325 RepID=UPI0018A25930|nr:DNA replication/repair protein RecF [Pseudomonas sp. N040]MBF7728871.1 DNA replication/repair protein RecF [Pseudomonas sp. N040]MBW7012511.1 DNA replication/repair protein RecF [Pseudomonas sp. N040]